MRLGRIAVLVTLMVAVGVVRAEAHAILIGSTPSSNQVVSGDAVSAKLTFNVRIDAKRSKLSWMGLDGQEHQIQIEDQKSPDTITAKFYRVPQGYYVIRWQVLAQDGHITRGEVPFHAQ